MRRHTDDESFPQGYVVVDSLFGSELIFRLRTEVLDLFKGGCMHPNHTHLVRKGVTLLLEKHSILESELTLDKIVQVGDRCGGMHVDSKQKASKTAPVSTR